MRRRTKWVIGGGVILGLSVFLLVALQIPALADRAPHRHSYPCNTWASYHHHNDIGCHTHNRPPRPTPRPTRRPTRVPTRVPTPRPTPRPTATAVPTAVPTPVPTPVTPQTLDVDLSGEAVTDNHLLLTQGGGPTMNVDIEIRPASVTVANSQGTTTTVFPPITQVEIYAVVEREIHCDDVRGIVGGCATLPRIGHRLWIAQPTITPATDPCATPADIMITEDLANELLAVNASGTAGGPGVWRLEAEITTAAVPAGSCSPPTTAAVPAATVTEDANQTTAVALRLADIVAE